MTSITYTALVCKVTLQFKNLVSCDNHSIFYESESGSPVTLLIRTNGIVIHTFVFSYEDIRTRSNMVLSNMFQACTDSSLYPLIKEALAVLNLNTYSNKPIRSSGMENKLVDFSTALVALKAGSKVARSGWNGKDQYVVAQAVTTTTEAINIWNPHNKEHAEKLGGQIDVAPYCTIKTAQDTLAIGWTPSSGDLFATDWIIL